MMTANWNEEESYETGVQLGDPRRCPIHGTVTSSPGGMFDAPCGECEFEANAWEDEESASERDTEPAPPPSQSRYNADPLDIEF